MIVMAMSLVTMIISGTVLLWPYKNATSRGEKLRKGIYCALCGLIFILVSGLRHYSVGADTVVYLEGYFKEIYWYQPYEIVELLGKYLTRHERTGPLFVLIVKFFQLFSANTQGYLVYAAVLITVPFCIWIYKHSEDPMLSFTLMFTLFFSTFWLTGQKQAIALAVVWVGSYPFLEKKKPIPFVLVCVLGAFIHTSALMFLPVYLLRLIPLKRRNFAIAAGAFTFLMLVKDMVYPIMVRLVGYEWYTPFSLGKPLKFTAMYLAIVAFLFLRFGALSQANNQERIWVNCILLGLVALPSVYVQNAAIRLIYIFEFPIVLAIPAAVSGMKFRNRMIFRYLIVLALLGITIVGGSDYIFFWQGEPL